MFTAGARLLTQDDGTDTNKNHSPWGRPGIYSLLAFYPSSWP